MAWLQRDFRTTVTAPRRPFERAGSAGVAAILGFVVLFLAVQRESTACRDACYDIGLRTFERGHAWTAYQDAWQWQAQWAIGVGAFAAALIALATTTRYRLRLWTAGLTLASLALAATWTLWCLLAPSPPA